MGDSAEATATFNRHHPFEGIHNFRDLGDYPTRHGRKTRPRSVFRSAALHGATAVDRERLAALGIGAIFDLRSHRELARDGFSDFAEIGAVREHAPVFPDVDASPEHVIARYKLYSEDVPTVYMLMLQRGAPSYRRVIEAVAGADVPIVYHCSGGKDRAGVLSALLLSIAGVERETIVEDYALTSRYLPSPAEERVAAFCQQFGLTREEFLAMHKSEPVSMLGTLARVDAEYGSVEEYLLSIGLDQTTLDRARERLLEPA
jgi:protein-tyrosine phosphatase